MSRSNKKIILNLDEEIYCSGIYKFRNKYTNKVYICEAVDVYRGIKDNLIKLYNHYHANTLLQDDFNKYTLEGFEISIVYETDENDAKKKDIYKIFRMCLKNYYMSMYKCNTYNFCQSGFNKEILKLDDFQRQNWMDIYRLIDYKDNNKILNCKVEII